MISPLVIKPRIRRVLSSYLTSFTFKGKQDFKNSPRQNIISLSVKPMAYWSRTLELANCDWSCQTGDYGYFISKTHGQIFFI